MHRAAALFAIAAACMAAAQLSAQPSTPSAETIARLREMSQSHSLGSGGAGSAIVVDPSSREATRQFYRAIYSASEGVPMLWTGNLTTGVPGDTDAAFKEAVRVRVNYFRAMAGVAGDVTLNTTFSTKDQQAALMMAANDQLSHTPPPSWTFYTAAGAEAAGNSNIALGSTGPDAVTGYIGDAGSNNAAVGHRRWILYPQTREMGTGDIPTVSPHFASNALWIIDSNVNGPRPTVRDTFVAWPNKGYVPYQLVFPRWSFSYPGANFATATVTMTRGGSSVPVSIESRITAPGSPENTIVWIYDNLSTNEATPHPKPSSDTTYTVNVNGVVISGTPQNFSYDVKVFDPDVAGGDFVDVTTSGTSTPTLGTANNYTVTRPSFTDSFQWRALQFASFSTVFGADPDMQGVTSSTTGAYVPRVTDIFATGSGAYHLAHPTPESQYLYLPGTYHLPAGGVGSMSFLSRIGFATVNQVARVQISFDDGVSWTDIHVETGTGGSGEASFSSHTEIPFAAYGGRTFRFRFAYTFSGDTFFNQTASNFGWLIDAITLHGVQSATVVSASATAAGTSFSFIPPAEATFALQARGVLFQSYPLAWGAVQTVTGTPGAGGTSRLVNLSVRTGAGTGDQTLIVGFVVGGAGTGQLLLRGIGPTLADFSVPGVLADPQLLFYSSTNTLLDQNNDWGGGATLTNAFASVLAFPLPPASKDAALLSNLGQSSYTAHCTSNAGTGIALVELYDTQPTGTARLINVSARTQVGTGDNILIAGFVIDGTVSKTLLIRGIGPRLGESPFGVAGVLADPQLALYSRSTLIQQNNDWGGGATLTNAFSTVFAFPLSGSSKDAAMLVSLAPGAYTAQVSGVGATTGVALVEIYEMP